MAPARIGEATGPEATAPAERAAADAAVPVSAPAADPG
jgi:hypothetical protein